MGKTGAEMDSLLPKQESNQTRISPKAIAIPKLEKNLTRIRPGAITFDPQKVKFGLDFDSKTVLDCKQGRNQSGTGPKAE